MIKDFKVYMRKNFYHWIATFCMIESIILYCDENYKWSAWFGWIAFIFISKYFFSGEMKDEVE